MALGGQEGLDKLGSMEYDCVFLDHMMPDMDGVETLHRIRQKPGAYFQTLPVIAFTANAIGGAREMFMEEGFDDFIAKPIELSVLERMLQRYIPKQKQVEVERQVQEEKTYSGDDMTRAVTDSALSGMDAQTEQPPAGASPEAEGLEALTRAGINISQGISYCGDREGLREIIAMYHAQGAGRSSQLKQLFEEQNWKNYAITAHALKSNSRGIGANDLAELAFGMEMAGKENRIEYILEHHAEFMKKHEELLAALADNSFIYPDGYHAPELQTEEAVQEIGSEQLKEQFMVLREKLDNFENEGVEEILKQLTPYAYQGANLSEMTAKIRQYVEEFDFLEAINVLDNWNGKIAGSRNGGSYDQENT